MDSLSFVRLFFLFVPYLSNFQFSISLGVNEHFTRFSLKMRLLFFVQNQKASTTFNDNIFSAPEINKVTKKICRAIRINKCQGLSNKVNCTLSYQSKFELIIVWPGVWKNEFQTHTNILLHTNYFFPPLLLFSLFFCDDF